jgi:hypothetical protein
MKFLGKSVSGVQGQVDSPEGIPGWESGTNQMGGSPKIRLNRAQGVESFDHNTVSVNEPLRLGRFVGVWLRKPPFFNETINAYWDYFFQDKILEVSGLSDNNIEVMTRTTGAVGREEAFAGYYKQTNSKFSIKVPEVKGSPVRKLLKYYLGGISDPVTGTNHFYGKPDFRFTKVNYTGDFLYVLLGPTMRPDDIEFACIWANAFPNIDLMGHLNSGAIGEAGSADLSFDVEFSGDFIQNNAVNRIAQNVVEGLGYHKDTREDVVLPGYMYDEYLINATGDSITERLGSGVADLKRKIAAAAEDGSKAAELAAETGNTLNNNLVIETSTGDAGETTVDAAQA